MKVPASMCLFSRRGFRSLFFSLVALAIFSDSLFAQALEETDVIPTVLSDSDKVTLSKEKTKLDELRKGLLDDIAQQNTECGYVAESNTFLVDLCQNRQGLIMGRIQNYKQQLGEYREKIQKAIFMAPQGKVAVQSGLVFKDIPAPVPSEKPIESKDPVSPSSDTDLQRMMEYLSNPENDPRVKRAREDADRFHDLHGTVSQAMLEEGNRVISRVRAETAWKNPRLSREEIDRIVSQHPDVKKVTMSWFLMQDQTRRMAEDREEDYVSTLTKTTSESNRKREME